MLSKIRQMPYTTLICTILNKQANQIKNQTDTENIVAMKGKGGWVKC